MIFTATWCSSAYCALSLLRITFQTEEVGNTAEDAEQKPSAEKVPDGLLKAIFGGDEDSLSGGSDEETSAGQSRAASPSAASPVANVKEQFVNIMDIAIDEKDEEEFGPALPPILLGNDRMFIPDCVLLESVNITLRS